jgi:hypothetical protein
MLSYQCFTMLLMLKVLHVLSYTPAALVLFRSNTTISCFLFLSLVIPKPKLGAVS